MVELQKIAVELLSFRNAMYHAMMVKMLVVNQAAEWGLVNESVEASKLKQRVTEVCNVLIQKIQLH